MPDPWYMRLRAKSVVPRYSSAEVPMSIPFLFIFRAVAFGGGRPGRSSDSVYFRVKFSPGRFAISRRIVRHGQYNYGDGISTRVGIPELSFVRGLSDRRVFTGIFGNSIWMPARPVTLSMTIQISSSLALSNEL